MKFKDFMHSFQHLMSACPQEELDPKGRYLIISDLHLGDGSPRDDLEPNRELLETALEKWYLENDYTLILNGDIEDINKFELKKIRRAWPRFFAIVNSFAQAGRLRKIVGNHDLGLIKEKDYPYPLAHGLVLQNDQQRLFIFHGHQASRFFIKYDYVSEFIVRYLAKPLRIRNSGISKDSRKQFATERRIYRAARHLGIVAISGHTHRPLFESLSKYDSLRWSLEELLREYPLADAQERQRIVDLVAVYRQELERLTKKEVKRDASRSLYGSGPLLVPCLFNSGCATGKTGISALEIERGTISLVHWARKGQTRTYIEREAVFKETVAGSFARYTLKTDKLDQVFARIELLSGRITPIGDYALDERQGPAATAI